VRLNGYFNLPIIVENNNDKPKNTSLNFTMTGKINQRYEIDVCDSFACWKEFPNTSLHIIYTKDVSQI